MSPHKETYTVKIKADPKQSDRSADFRPSEENFCLYKIESLQQLESFGVQGFFQSQVQ